MEERELVFFPLCPSRRVSVLSRAGDPGPLLVCPQAVRAASHPAFRASARGVATLRGSGMCRGLETLSDVPPHGARKAASMTTCASVSPPAGETACGPPPTQERQSPGPRLPSSLPCHSVAV